MSRAITAHLARCVLPALVACMTTSGAQARPISNLAALMATTESVAYLPNNGSVLQSGFSPVRTNPDGSTDQATADISSGSDTDGGNYVEVALTNTRAAFSNPTPGNDSVGYGYQHAVGYQIWLPPYTLGSSALYRLNWKIKVMPWDASTKVPPQMDIYALYANQDGQVFTQNLAESVADNHQTAVQTLLADVMTGAVNTSTGNTVTKATPMLLIQNLFPQDKIRIRIYGAAINTYNIGSNLIHALDGVATLKPGAVAKFTAHLSNTAATGLNGNYTAEFRLLSYGWVTPLGTTSVNLTAPTGSNAVKDITLPFQATLPSNLSNGTYAVQVRLIPGAGGRGVRLGMADTDVREINYFFSGYTYNIGTVNISSSAGGMFIGATANRYPYRYNGTTEIVATTEMGTAWQPNQLGLNAARTSLGTAWTTSALGSSTLVFDPAQYTHAFRWADATFHTELLPRVLLADWANYFSPNAAPTKSLLINTWGMPYEASRDPTNTDNPYNQGGLNAPASPNGFTAYQNFLLKAFQTYGNRMFAVECGNEPNNHRSWTGTQTELADSCEAIYNARASAGRTAIPIICPQADTPEKMGYVLSAKTSGGMPITNYCDWIGAHIYGGMGSDTTGMPYAQISVAEQIRTIKSRMSAWGVGSKPIVITEYGLNTGGNQGYYTRPANLNTMSDAAKADALYQSIATVQEAGVLGVMLYSLDGGGTENYLWTLSPSNDNTYNDTVMTRLKKAITDFGTTRTPW